MVNDNERVTKEGFLGAWIPLIVITIVMVVLTIAIFGGIWQFWMWFAEMGGVIPVVIVSILYFGRDSKKCPKCGTRMDYNVEYCKKCGTPIPSKCPECGASIQSNSIFCEKCGIQFAGNTALSSDNRKAKNPQSAEYPINDSQENYKYCPGCGNKMGLYAKHCSSCGIEL